MFKSDVEEHVLFVLFVSLLHNLHERNFRVKIAFGSGIVGFLPFEA